MAIEDGMPGPVWRQRTLLAARRLVTLSVVLDFGANAANLIKTNAGVLQILDL